MPSARPLTITWLPDARPRERHVAVGEFDGVHLGHREVIRGADTVLTFDPHPLAVVAPAAAPKLLTSLATKADLVAQLGVRELVVIPFDGEFASQSPEAFIERVLVEQLGARRVSVGENFRFGHRARGDVALLQAQDGFETRVARLVEVDVAERFLGAPFELRGIVQHGDKRGRELGYPTANLVPDDAYVCPGHGVYACRAGVRDGDHWRWWTAATSIGVRPTFVTGRGVLIEAFLLDYDGDLYGRELRVQFLSRLRGERRFDSVDALIAQMDVDVQHARSLAPADV